MPGNDYYLSEILKNDSKVLITGATGFIGANIVRRLLSTNCQVHILVRPKSSFAKVADVKSRLKIHVADLKDLPKLTKIVRGVGPDVIFHLASENVYSVNWEENYSKMVETNILGTVNLLTACEGVAYKCFVNTGTSSEYGLMEKAVKESDTCRPNSLYAITKYAGTLYSQMWALTRRRPALTLRPFSPYGPFDSNKRLIANTIICALKNRDIALTAPDVVRDYVYVDDVVDAYMKCIDSARNCAGEVFNIGSGESHRIGEVVEKIVSLTSSKSKLLWRRVAVPNEETKVWQADLAKTKEKLGWKPKYSLEAGLGETIRWFENHIGLYE